MLVLSLFPGIGLLDRAFEEEGFCVVRGPDLLWGGDIKRFHLPAGRFDGVIGGPPCQQFSPLARLVRHAGYTVAENLIPEFERCIAEAEPGWFLMENVPDAPLPSVNGYMVHDVLIRDVWVGGETMRLRRFSFGTGDGRKLRIEQLALHRPDPLPAVLASGGSWVPVKNSGSGKPKRIKTRGDSTRSGIYGDKTERYFNEAKVAQGLEADFDLPPFKTRAKVKAIGNGVPLAMGRAVASAVKRAFCEP